jgi:hypothetical protein
MKTFTLSLSTVIGMICIGWVCKDIYQSNMTLVQKLTDTILIGLWWADSVALHHNRILSFSWGKPDESK